jgi:Peptidase S46
VTGAVQAGASDKAARQARKAAMAQIEKQCSESTKQRCDVVTLYQDSEYWLYRYKKYTDVRLVFAPEQGIAFFGGNSGSPVVNQAGEVIGLIFDGNIENLGGDFFYKGQTDRALAVHANAITEALEKIYAAPALAAELKNGVPALAANDK